MNTIALKMLFGDRAKYLGLIFGIVFATLLMSQQISIFIGLMERCASQIRDIKEADIWVMDPQVNYVDEIQLLNHNAINKVRGVEGVQWAVPLYKGLGVVRALDGTIQQILLMGIDDASLVGKPPAMVKGQWQDIKNADGVIIDKAGYHFMWPGQDLTLGKEIEINDKRVTISAICSASAPFLTFPIIYGKLSLIGQILGGNKNISFILVKAGPNQSVVNLSKLISQKTGLKAITKSEFEMATINHYLKRTGIPINFGITVVLGFIIGTAIVGQTFYLFVVENLRQFAALKAIGVTNKQILKMVLLQASTVGAIGYSIGIGLCSNFFYVTRDVPALQGFGLHWQVALGTLVAVCLISLLASLMSIKKVLVIDPAIVFRG
jgi:putative ABC transport system permease protein